MDVDAAFRATIELIANVFKLSLSRSGMKARETHDAAVACFAPSSMLCEMPRVIASIHTNGSVRFGTLRVGSVMEMIEASIIESARPGAVE